MMSRPSMLLPIDDQREELRERLLQTPHIGDQLVVAVPAVDLDAGLVRRIRARKRARRGRRAGRRRGGRLRGNRRAAGGAGEGDGQESSTHHSHLTVSLAVPPFCATTFTVTDLAGPRLDDPLDPLAPARTGDGRIELVLGGAGDDRRRVDVDLHQHRLDGPRRDRLLQRGRPAAAVLDLGADAVQPAAQLASRSTRRRPSAARRSRARPGTSRAARRAAPPRTPPARSRTAASRRSPRRRASDACTASTARTRRAASRRATPATCVVGAWSAFAARGRGGGAGGTARQRGGRPVCGFRRGGSPGPAPGTLTARGRKRRDAELEIGPLVERAGGLARRRQLLMPVIAV